ncbi:hypothetical protein L6452_03039 [Arctium lappa]|uniref:Uncharacterized protein n=1 Tax=Arctium lappa TaxID=4217 RepID=A0ACB9FLP7_ARCLA|nr:hypothetical protein L6452_03039 [Arctium lappa]
MCDLQLVSDGFCVGPPTAALAVNDDDDHREQIGAEVDHVAPMSGFPLMLVILPKSNNLLVTPVNRVIVARFGLSYQHVNGSFPLISYFRSTIIRTKRASRSKGRAGAAGGLIATISGQRSSGPSGKVGATGGLGLKTRLRPDLVIIPYLQGMMIKLGLRRVLSPSPPALLYRLVRMIVDWK